METSIVSVVDLDLKPGRSAKGPWTLCMVTGSDREKYKTFDENLIAKLRQAHGGAPIAITYEPVPRSYVDRNGNKVDTTDRTIKSVAPAQPIVGAKPAAPAPAAKPAPAPVVKANGTEKQSPAYWEEKAKLDFQRTAHMSALKAAAEVMVALINAKVESYKYEDALLLVKGQADKLYAAFFKAYEGGANVQSTDSADEYYTDTAYDAAGNS